MDSCVQTMTSQKTNIDIVIDTRLFSLNTILGTAYELLNEFFFKIDGNPDDEIIVTLKPRKNGLSVEEAEERFNEALIDYTFNEYNLKAKSNIRRYFTQSALSFEPHGIDLWSLLQQQELGELENVDYYVSSGDQKDTINIVVNLGGNTLESVLIRVLFVSQRLRKYCRFHVKRVKDKDIIAHIKVRNGSVESIMNKVNSELENAFSSHDVWQYLIRPFPIEPAAVL